MEDDLFDGDKGGDIAPDAPLTPPGAADKSPLAARMRPRTLEEFVGQHHLLGPGRLLRRAIESDRMESVLLYGPPGTGKTTLAMIIGNATSSRVEHLNAVEASVADLRRVMSAAAHRLPQRRTILFIDEIHRFSKAQQDVLLPEVESGVIRLIGATTQNPYFTINPPLISRSLVFQLEPLTTEDLMVLGHRALTDPRGLGSDDMDHMDHTGHTGHTGVEVDEDALLHLARTSDGDARRFLNALEIAVRTTPPGADGCIRITHAVAEESIQTKAVVYDRDGDGHYDTISAFIKSVRGSDPDAAIYWLAKMLHAGEDLRFIARRIVISAAEDIGLADPQALVVAVAAQQAAVCVGLPEAQLPLAQATIYLAMAPKSCSATRAIGTARKDIAQGRTLEVPRALRSTGYAGAAALGHGKGYVSAHESAGGFVPQAFLPEGRVYYRPEGRGYEKRIEERLEELRRRFEQARREGGAEEADGSGQQ